MKDRRSVASRNKLVAASALSALAVLLLAACSPGDGSQTATSPTGQQAVGAADTAPPVPAGDPDLPDIAGENCIKQLAETANQPASKIYVIRVDVDETGPTHYLQIEGAAAPWSCKTTPNGAVTDLIYTQEG